MIPNNIAYFSGVHGTGKSTLMDEIISKNSGAFSRMEKLPILKSTDHYERQRIRMVRYYSHALYEREWAEENPDKIGLRDRCIIDGFAYMFGYLKLGFIEEEGFRQLLASAILFFSAPKRLEDIQLHKSNLDKLDFRLMEKSLIDINNPSPYNLMPRNVIFVDPPLETTIAQIKNRWNETGVVKWNEKDFNYLEKTREAFKQFFSTYPANVLHLEETNLEKRVKICSEWLLKLQRTIPER